jgi:hypothetical protein
MIPSRMLKHAAIGDRETLEARIMKRQPMHELIHCFIGLLM